MSSPRPGNAARLSEDIGDVLSAIRRLIAEDEALDYARDTLEKQQAAQADDLAVPAHPLSRPHDGHAAMARRMVAQGTAALSARMAQAATQEQPPAADMVPASFRSRLVADESTPASRTASTRLVASRDLPARRDHACLGAPPLRLRESDRVITGIANETDAEAPWADHQPEISHLQSAHGLDHLTPSTAVTIAADDDEDDFAEAFDAKARMRPVVEVAVMADLPVAAVDDAPETIADADAGGAFWQAYANSADQVAADEALTPDAETDTWIGSALDENDIAIEAGTFAETFDRLDKQEDEVEDQIADWADEPIVDAAEAPAHFAADMPQDEPADLPAFAALSIPSYPADEIIDEDEPQLIEASQPEPILPQQIDDDVSQAVPADTADAADSAAEGKLVAPFAEPAIADEGVATADPSAGIAALSQDDDTAEDEETTIRELIREMVQEELHGELGQRFSRNLRAVIRREVASAIDDHLERL